MGDGPDPPSSTSNSALEQAEEVSRTEMFRRYIKEFFGAEQGNRDVRLYEAEAIAGGDVESTERFLREVVEKPDKIHRATMESGKVWGWWWLSMTPKAKEKVEKYKGIKCVNHMKMVEDYEHETAPKVSASGYHGAQLYNAMVKGWGVDVKATEEFLKSKVRNPGEIKRHTWEHVVHGWSNLSLDAEDKREVEGHEVVETLELMRDVKWLREPSDQVNSVKSYYALPDEGVDTAKTEEFLRSQVRSSRCIYARGRRKHGKVMGWSLMLDYTGLQRASQYGGIREVLCPGEVESF